MTVAAGPDLVNFGCRLNLAEGEGARRAAIAAGAGDVIIVNSCAVTSEATRQARQAVRRLARVHPDRRIVVTGCLAETDRAAMAALPGVAGIVSNVGKTDPVSWASISPRPNAHVFAPPPVFAPVSSGAAHARAFIAVQNGCDHRCTFCIIPYGRGPSRSAPVAAVLNAVDAALESGQREVVLTGVDLTSYGHDLPNAPRLGDLVAAILAHAPGLARLRLSSLDPVEIDPLLFDLLTGEARVMPYVHLSLQAGHDLILKRMKRRHSRADAVHLVERLHAARPAIAIGADIIAGFPTEDDAMFAATRALIKDCAIMFAHVFPFSPRGGTPAARMPQVDRRIVRARAATLRAAAADRRAAWQAGLVGSAVQVLVEADGTRGHAENFLSVTLDRPCVRGKVVTARLTGPGTAMVLDRVDVEAVAA